MRKPARSISVVVPCFNESEAIAQCHERLTHVLKILDTWYEIVYVDDGSRDSTVLSLQAIHSSDPNVTVVELSRNFGHQIAVTAGLEVATGEVVVIMDADLQDPPEVIEEMLQIWEQGYEVVYGVRETREGELDSSCGRLESSIGLSIRSLMSRSRRIRATFVFWIERRLRQ